MSYKLPGTLSQDIQKLNDLAIGYRNNTVTPTEFKAFRVPMGVYEQRKNEVYMVRIRATGGVISPKQLLGVIDIAQKAGSNLLHISTRAEVQIQNLELEKVDEVLRSLQKIGLAAKGGGGNTVRNIIVSEFSGIDKDEAFDATPYAMALTSEAVAEADSYLMPRKLKIAFSSNADFIDYAGVNDIGLVAQIKDGKRGFKVYVGGGAGSKPTVGWLYKDFMPVDDLYALVKAVKRFFMDNGNRKNRHKARIRFIFYRLGEKETFALLDKYFEEEKRKGRVLDVNPYFNEPSIAANDASKASVILPFVWGNIWLDKEEQLAKLKALLNRVAQLGENTLRFTPKQNIRLRNIPQDNLEEVKNLLADYTPDSRLPLVLNNIVSCTGADTCRLGICLSKGLANAIFAALKNSGLDLGYLADARINITGCPNLCGQPLWSDLGFMGKVLHTDHAYPAYQVFIGANYVDNPKLAEAIGTLNAHSVPEFVVDLATKFIDVAEIADSLGQQLSFGKWLRGKAGRNAALRILGEHSHVPLFSEDKNYYFDWGSDEVFKVTQRGKPECSAGVFDMITVDKGYIDDYRKKGDAYHVLFHTSRMLLVTRGVDPQDAAGVFDAFIEHFVDTGLVEASYKDILLKAKAEGENGSYDSAVANTLADAVNELYEGMDDSLQFKKKDQAPAQPSAPAAEVAPATEVKAEPVAEKSAETPASASSVSRKKDLRGVLCPMNFVRTKLELASMQSGDVLEILLDDGAPIENVPGSVRLEGHTVLSEEQQSEGHWKVTIRKK